MLGVRLQTRQYTRRLWTAMQSQRKWLKLRQERMKNIFSVSNPSQISIFGTINRYYCFGKVSETMKIILKQQIIVHYTRMSADSSCRAV